MLRYTKTYNKEQHLYTYIIEDTIIKNQDQIVFVGTSKCNPQDYDFENEYTGYFIAESRAKIKYFKYLIKEEQKKNNYIYSLLNTCPHKTKKEQATYNYLQNIYTSNCSLINTYKDFVNYTKNELTKYIHIKEKMYQQIRENRKPKGES